MLGLCDCYNIVVVVIVIVMLVCKLANKSVVKIETLWSTESSCSMNRKIVW